MLLAAEAVPVNDPVNDPVSFVPIMVPVFTKFEADIVPLLVMLTDVKVLVEGLYPNWWAPVESTPKLVPAEATTE